MGKFKFKTNIVERYANGEGSYTIGKDEGCSYNTVLRALKRERVDTSLTPWTKKEIAQLIKLYPVTAVGELPVLFPRREKGNIINMVSRLRLKKQAIRKKCKDCAEVFILKNKHERMVCAKCSKKKYTQSNLEKAKKAQEKWLSKNPYYLKEYCRRPEVKKRMYNYMKRLRAENPKFRLDMNMGIAIYQALRDKKGGRRWESLVEYSFDDLTKHLEVLFDKNMKWENYGSYWHIDHIKPRSLFYYTTPDELEFKQCWALDNLQPLEKHANMRKSNKFVVEKSSENM